jgi:hypothetical protein
MDQSSRCSRPLNALSLNDFLLKQGNFSVKDFVFFLCFFPSFCVRTLDFRSYSLMAIHLLRANAALFDLVQVLPKLIKRSANISLALPFGG